MFYWEEALGEHNLTVKTVAATELETDLTGLKMFTEYAMLVLAFNAAGDGPNITVPVIAKTEEGGICHIKLDSLINLEGIITIQIFCDVNE